MLITIHCIVSNDEALKTGRWFSSWVLFSSWVPLVLLHVIWIYGTITNEIEDTSAEDGCNKVGNIFRGTEMSNSTKSPMSPNLNEREEGGTNQAY